MFDCLIVADDLTGANGTGILLVNKGLEVITVFEKEKLKENLCYEGIVYSTDTRCSKEDRAYKTVIETLKSFQSKNVMSYGKRIDSTLRGNIGAEIKAFLDILGDDVIACVVPCYPKMGRIVKNGIMYVNGVLLEDTEAATDALKPVNSSKVEDIIKEQTDYSIETFHHFELQQGGEYLLEKIKRSIEENNRILVFDGVCEEDIHLISETLVKSKINFFSVDPGPFTAEVISRKRNSNKVLAVVGTTNPVARKQLEVLISKQDVYSVEVDVKAVLKGGLSRSNELKRVVKLILENRTCFKKYCAYGNSIFPDKKNDLDVISEEQNLPVELLVRGINSFFAEIAFQVFQADKMFSGLFTCGGDITVAVCKKFEAKGMIPRSEVLPLAVYGEFLGKDGRYIGLVTKGGMVGQNDAMDKCVNYLSQIK